MAASQTMNLDEEEFHNWIKKGIAIVITKEGLQDFVVDEISQFRRRIYDDIQKTKGISLTDTCTQCTTESVVKCNRNNKMCQFKKGRCIQPHKPCPLGICDDVRDMIVRAHRWYSGPSWRNTDATCWGSSDWEVAKCFMPPDGYQNVTSIKDTDFNGIINVILNYKDFQAKINEDLTIPLNMFCQARDVGKSYRHCTQFKVSNKDLQDSLRTLTNVLTDPKSLAGDEKAKKAVNELNQLSQASWTITDKNIFKHLLQAIGEAKEGFVKAKDEVLEEAKDFIKTNAKQDITGVLTKLHLLVTKHKDEINREAEHAIKRIRTESENAEVIYKRQRTHDDADYDQHKAKLQQSLIQTYRRRCKNLPVSPLLEEEELPLLTFYVEPNMRCTDHHRVQKDKEKKHVESYKDIFFNDKQLCKNIYITGAAGIGKTVMCQRMVLLWCLDKEPVTDIDDKSILVDSETLKEFNFLFYISLRDTTFCRIEDIICHQILGSTNSKEFVRKILQTEKCLIILDGLDEWTHSKDITNCPSNIKVPHREGLDNCVFLTTSRPYKLEQLRMKTHEIDQHIEILQMEEGVGFEFIELLVDILNDKCGENKDPVTFIEEVAENKLEDLLDIPLITAHLICLWFDEKLTRMSVSEVYGNTLEMMFERASKRVSRSEPVCLDVTEREESNLKSPEIIRRLVRVQEHIPVLYKLSYLAFDTLFSESESSLVFSNTDLDEYGITDQISTYLCSVGILSKSKAIGSLTERRHTISFPHKLYQEFFAALYISLSENNRTYIHDKIVAACRSLVDIKKFSDVFIFLASLAPTVVETLFQKVNSVLSKDKAVSDFREFSCCAMYHFISQRRQQVEYMVKSLQELAVKCYNESRRSGVENIDFKLEDIFIYQSNVSQITAMLQSSRASLKSVFTSGSHLGDELGNVSGLVRLEIRYIKQEEGFQKYANVMSTSSETLKNISICYCPVASEMPFESLNQLTSLYIHKVNIEHEYLHRLMGFIANKRDMSQIGLDEVRCKQHDTECTLGEFDLRRHEKMFLLGIGSINLQSVLVEKESLLRLNLSYTKIFDQTGWAAHLMRSLTFSRVLKKVVIRGINDKDTSKALVRMISSLQNIKYIFLLNIDFFDSILELDPEGTDVDIEMSHVKLTRDSFCRFVKSVDSGNNDASVNLLFYEISPSECDVRHVLHSFPRLQVSLQTDVSLKFRTKSRESMKKKEL